ncbi:MAG: hypothetical protein ACXVP0_06455 [Bacteroidia bacterium]
MRLLSLLPVIALCCSCSTAYLTLKSEPPGATVYAVPKLIRDADTAWYSDPAHINAYIIKEGVTPTHTSLRKAPYTLVFVLGEKRKQIILDLSTTGRKSGKTVEAIFR